eukprot:CAMPEP_0176127348 /NCGR_PEP_ID=MMETSP0120_2-20121206/64312_1 /TAXON_ID=160619 /ORGANISM="Kryptoperidinium foliaceum, Strain CCMP 1326" /LENGTH=84 /DNA_ID=CAMNT_0017462357 /DNA_START=126 /DNA_END=376 /DNA_ORIENTATION=+
MTDICHITSFAAAWCKAFMPCSLQLFGMSTDKAKRTESTLLWTTATSKNDSPKQFLTDKSERHLINSCCTSTTSETMAKDMGGS